MWGTLLISLNMIRKYSGELCYLNYDYFPYYCNPTITTLSTAFKKIAVFCKGKIGSRISAIDHEKLLSNRQTADQQSWVYNLVDRYGISKYS